MVMRLLGNFVAVKSRRCRGYWHHHDADAVICCDYFACEGIQPERLKAEGFSPSARSRGWSVSATPGMPTSPRKAKDANVVAVEAGFHIIRTLNDG